MKENKNITEIVNIICFVVLVLIVGYLINNMILTMFSDDEVIVENDLFSSGDSSRDSSGNSNSSNTQYLTSFSDEEIGDMFTDRDLEYTYDESDATKIVLNNESITISEEGIYILSGTISDGQVIIEASDSDKVQLILDGVTINSNSSAAIYVKSSDKVFITLAQDSENTVSTSGEYVAIDDNDIDAVIFSKSDLSFNGTGLLTIDAMYGHGIVGKDDVVFTGGIYSITSLNHGVNANDSVRMKDVTLIIESGKDGIQCENTDDLTKGYIYIESGLFTIISDADCFDSSSCLQIDGGEFNLSSGGGYDGVLNSITVGEGAGNAVMPADNLEYSMKCLKAETIIFNDGVYNLSSYEDTIHSNGDLTINNGEFYILTGDDAIHADYDLIINEAIIDIEYGYEGIEGDNITINGGNINLAVLDDGINVGSSSGMLTINGGTIYVACQGDGLDSNGDFTMTGGDVILDVSAIYVGGDGEIDVSGSSSITGGTIVDENGNEVSTSISSSGSSNSSRPSSGFSSRR